MQDQHDQSVLNGFVLRSNAANVHNLTIPHPVQSHNHKNNGSFKMKPQLYDGTEGLDDYLSQFEIASELNGWDYNLKSLYLASSLTGCAHALLNVLTSAQRRDYKSLVNVLNL
ncbi:hypothetical protein CHS0354_004804 [Potamilus streckersoni]|uniref:Uncharacterized protein n=1 Tax=Potamilus streckersoni TaxID=2493646 RepID=A0AAE0VSH4_9BIVA|nr:hypothetical protein CHS0354_004804 [Potamilus streckersoni]